MKVLMIGNAGYVHVARWAAGIAATGVDVTLLSKQPASFEGVRWQPDEVPPARPWRLQRLPVRRRNMLKRILAATQPDIIHVHFPGPYSVFPEDLEGIPLVAMTWGSEVHPREDECAETKARKKAILHRADRVVASSEFLANATCSYAGLPADNVEVNYWGVDLSKFYPSPRLQSEPVIGFAKHLLPTYGPDYLLEAFHSVATAIPEARLRMAGNGSLKEELREHSRRLGLESKIEWCGSIPHAEIPSFFRTLAVSVMPSLRETLGIAAIESQAVGVPVVATDVGGIPESVVDGQTGILVPVRDSKRLAEAIISLLKDHQGRSQMGQNGRQHVKDKFDWNRTLERMLESYRSVLNSAGRRDGVSRNLSAGDG